jgi:hypothetical protein
VLIHSTCRRVQDLLAERDRREQSLQEHGEAASGALRQLREAETTLLADKEQYAAALVRADADRERLGRAVRDLQLDRNRLATDLHQVRTAFADSQQQVHFSDCHTFRFHVVFTHFTRFSAISIVFHAIFVFFTATLRIFLRF